MATTYSRKQIYRFAYRYHFQNYGSSQLGKGPDHRSHTLIFAGIALAALLQGYNSWRCGLSAELILPVAAMSICGLIAVHCRIEWQRYSGLAYNFAKKALDQELCTPEEVKDLFAETYPWLV